MRHWSIILRFVRRALPVAAGALLVVALVRWFLLTFGYQPNDANLPVLLFLSALLTAVILLFRFPR